MNQTTNAGQNRSEQKSSKRSSSSYRSGQHRHSRSQKKIFKLLVLSWVLGAALLVAVFGIILSSAETSTVKSDYYQYQSTVQQQLEDKKRLEGKLKELEEENRSLGEKLKKLVAGRIPNLRPLEFDVTVPIKDGYFQHISFTLTGTQSNSNYEYRAVLKNSGKRPIEPDVTIFLFDKMGVQVGMTKLSRDEATSTVERDALKPGERRAYASNITLSRHAVPEYFLIEVK
jgi:cell division protein FtsL